MFHSAKVAGFLDTLDGADYPPKNLVGSPQAVRVSSQELIGPLYASKVHKHDFAGVDLDSGIYRRERVDLEFAGLAA